MEEISIKSKKEERFKVMEMLFFLIILYELTYKIKNRILPSYAGLLNYTLECLAMFFRYSDGDNPFTFLKSRLKYSGLS